MARRGFSQKEILNGCIDAGWYCQLTGIPLVLPAALCLLERLVSCAAGRSGGTPHGYYDYRQARWNAPLNALTFPAGDHVHAHAKGGATTADNLQMLAGLVNETKSSRELVVVPPQDRVACGDAEERCAQTGERVLYWPPSSTFWGDRSRVTDAQRRVPRGRNGESSEWDGMVGVFLRLYRPDLPELTVHWNPRDDRGRDDVTLLAGWYRTIREVAAERPAFHERYQHLAEVDCLWPAPLP
jgi:hypothetical protein